MFYREVMKKIVGVAYFSGWMPVAFEQEVLEDDLKKSLSFS